MKRKPIPGESGGKVVQIFMAFADWFHALKKRFSASSGSRRPSAIILSAHN